LEVASDGAVALARMSLGRLAEGDLGDELRDWLLEGMVRDGDVVTD
jgi:hypothetical protein